MRFRVLEKPGDVICGRRPNFASKAEQSGRPRQNGNRKFHALIVTFAVLDLQGAARKPKVS